MRLAGTRLGPREKISPAAQAAPGPQPSARSRQAIARPASGYERSMTTLGCQDGVAGEPEQGREEQLAREVVVGAGQLPGGGEVDVGVEEVGRVSDDGVGDPRQH